MPDAMNFAVVGCGAIAQAQHIPNLIRLPEAELHTCVDPDQQVLTLCRERFGAARTCTDYHEAIADPEVEAICLATTEKLRLPVIRAAAEADKPIYVEKPLARSLEEVYEIQKVVNDAGIAFCVGHNRRASPAMIDAHRLFRDHMASPNTTWRPECEPDQRPALSEDGTAAISVRINDDWHSWKAWVFDKQQAPHGAMLFEMTHFTDVCNWMLDSEPTEVVAMENGMLNHGVVIRYRGGEMATICMGSNGSFGYPKELYEMMGNGGVVAIDHMVEVRTAGIADAPARKDYPLRDDPDPDSPGEGGLRGWAAKRAEAMHKAQRAGAAGMTAPPEPDKGHAHALRRFIAEIRGEGDPVCPVDDAIQATRVAFAAVRSAAEGRIVKMEEI